MAIPRSSQPPCPITKHCSQWAAKYMHNCLCSTNQWVSFSLGIISVMTWFVAEIPQIVTNCKKKSADGISLLFLLTWVAGDLMNLFGCILEPTTLPTQYYMALLFTVTTFVFTGQTIYYQYIYPRLKSYKCAHEVGQNVMITKDSYGVVKVADGVEGFGNRMECLASGVAASLPILMPSDPRVGYPEELNFISARSLSLSWTPKMGSFPQQSSSTSDSVPFSARVPLLCEVGSPRSAPPSNFKSMFCAVSLVVFFAGSLNLQNAHPSEQMLIFQNPRVELVKQVGRKLLETDRSTMERTSTVEVSKVGTLLGWGMAFIYMGGRLPQICLNIKRRNVEGLNPLMFVLALVGNITYLASMLVSSVAWTKIKPNLPWLVDAGGCALLDTLLKKTIDTATPEQRQIRALQKH